MVEVFIGDHRQKIPADISILEMPFDELYAVDTNAISLVVDDHIVEDLHGELVHPERQDHVFQHFKTLVTNTPTSAFVQSSQQGTKVDV